MNASICTGLILAILGGRVLAEELVRLCAENIEACSQLLQDYDDGYRDKRFLRFGRALSGDTFFRFGKGQDKIHGFLGIGQSDPYPIEDKRFLRFGRTNVNNAEDLLAELTSKIKEFELANKVNLRKKRSADKVEVSKSDTVVTTKTEKNINEEETRDSRVRDKTGPNKNLMKIDINPNVTTTSKENHLKEIDSVENDINRKEVEFVGIKQAGKQEEDSEIDKRFMRIGRDPKHEAGSEVDKRFMRIGRASYDDIEDEKRFMRIGRDPDTEKRFMRIGRDPIIESDINKRFMRIGKSLDKRFMRIGRDGADKRFMRIGRDPVEEKQLDTYNEGNVENEKRFMRIGRGEPEEEEDKRFMRIGRGNEVDTDLDDKSAINEDKRFMRIGKRFMRIGKSKPDESPEKRFMRIGRSKRFIRNGRSIIDNLANKRFIRFGRNIGDTDKIYMRFGQ